jgi:YfiH family protein
MKGSTRPQPSGGFEWTQAPWGAVLRCRPLQAVADHFFTVSPLQLRNDNGDWEAVAALAGIARQRLLLLRQVHGRAVAVASAENTESWNPPEADALISNDPSAALVVRVADCAPILIADRRLGVAAAVHAGWRSTLQRIAPAAVAAMQTQYGTKAADLVVAIGPSLGSCCGEMGDEVVQAFRDAGHQDAAIGRWFSREPGRRAHFDLWLANSDQLEEIGVTPASIHISGLCTRTYSDLLHSYRAKGQRAGRMAGVIKANR